MNASTAPSRQEARDAPALRLGPALAASAMAEVRRAMELRHCKWDAQVGDVCALASRPLLITSTSWRELATLAERLFAETAAIERELAARPRLQARVGVPRALRRLLARGAPTPAAARIMRFDFHPTADGWRVSEVNSDVPGGFTEATSFTALVAAHVPGARPAGDPTAAVVDALVRAIGDAGAVALISAPGHMEDHQVVACLAAALRARGREAHTLSLNQLAWRDGHAHFGSQPLGAVYRFYQAEWLAALGERYAWRPLFVGGRTPVVNPGTAVLTESKRLPLVWDALATPIPTWRRLLPETRALGDAPWVTDDGWLIKSAYCNTGDTVCIRAALPRAEWWRRSVKARLRPGQWLAQRRFAVAPLYDDDGPLFPCVGVYVVDGKAAGIYARVTRGPVIDFAARDAAVLVYDDA